MGFDISDPTSDFWNFVIPGVGRVPIYAFLGLMTAFVVVIGPLNYIYLRRRAKLHLMIITVPLCAAAVTVSLFAYALISDGLGLRVRVRSYTQIDQRRGEAVCWSRLCYYAGLAPSQGLTFSGDVAVLPIADDSQGRRQGETRQVGWTKDGRQHLSSGWLRSRTLTQFYTARSRRTDARLDIDAKDGRLTVTNQLGTPIQHLVVCDASGKLYHTDHLAQGATAELTAAEDAMEASRAVREAFRTNRLQRDENRGGDVVATVVPPGAGGPAVSGLSLSRMEAGLATALQQVTDGKLEPRSYVAIVERSPEMELGTPSAQEEAGFHVILGRW